MMLYVYCGNYDDDDRQEKPVLIEELFGRRFAENCNALYRYIYLSDWYKIICSCAEDFALRMMDALDADIDTIKKKFHKENAKHFKETVLSIAESDLAVEIRGNRYLSMQMVIFEADKELSRLNDDVLSYAFERGARAVFM